jgi:hypothetical protein
MTVSVDPTPKPNALIRVKNFVVRNERRILATTTIVSTTLVVVQRAGLKQHNDFLKEKGLFSEYYNSESLAESLASK